ncbi:hypothetical protein K3179_02375 [Qipengyuania sp. GH38]|uniref:DUF5818 domain-containing protein n=1 Tax=Qipengyuania intermedia TaxID=2867244 RepID=UPI001C87CFD5|nr:DUF5818 domain-containing protein [Qipengyuania intermedia]MBX7513388.1 hypothetical protein [Qipengyuania intermedia]
MKYAGLVLTATLLASCSQDTSEPGEARQAEPERPSADQSSGKASLVTVEGRVETGAECLVVRTPDGVVWSVNFGEADFGPGDYIRISGKIADASFCMQGRGTIVPDRIDAVAPPAADRDPARSGGIALDREYVSGTWVAKGLNANCSDPDFRIKTSAAGTILNGDISRHDNSALVILDAYPRIDLDEPMDDLPIEARGPDGLAVLRPATDAAYDPISIGSATIEGDGIVFVKCA